MIKKHCFLFCCLLFSTIASAQSGSGTIVFNAQGANTALINAQAKRIDALDTYAISGNTDETLNFSQWSTGSLGIEEFEQGIENYLIAQNPSSELDVFIRTDNSENISSRVFNMLGQQVAAPRIINQSNGVSELYANMSNLSNGMYIVQVLGAQKPFSFKFLKNNSSADGPNGINSSIMRNLPKSNNNSKNIASKTTGANNYTISWDEIDLAGNSKILSGSKDVEVLENDSNALSIDMTLYENKTGDVAILPVFNNIQKNNTTITLTNTQVRDSTYTISTTTNSSQAIFYNVHIADNVNGADYEVKIVDNLTDGTFLETIKTITLFQDDADTNTIINGSKIIDLNVIPNEQDITFTIRNYSTLALASGVSIDLINENTNSTISTQVSDASGNVTFDNVPGETPVHTVISKSGHYTKTNGKYTTPKVDRISEMDEALNVISVPFFNYSNGAQVDAADIQKYKPLEMNTEFLLGHLRIFYPTSPNRQLYINHFNEVATQLGMSGAIIDYDTAFPTPSTAQINAYDPYPQTREVFDGEIGTNITNYVGTATGNGGKTLSNGNKIVFYALGWDLGGLEWNRTEHELGNLLGFPLLSGNTSRSSDAGSSTTIANSLEDSAIMPFWLKMGKYHYDTSDSQNRLIEYSLPTKFE